MANRRGGWLSTEVGGMPVWGMIASVVFVLAITVFSLISGANTAAPQSWNRFTPQPETEAEPVALWIGDSFTEASQVPEAERFPTLVSSHFNWHVENRAEGGTGYVTDGPAEFPEREPLPSHVASVVEAQPDVVFVAGGLNDTSRGYSEDQIRDAVRATLGDLRSGLPDAEIFVVGPFWPRGDPIAEVLLVRDIVKEESQSLGLPFLDPIDGGWVNRDASLIGPDGTHPSAAGQAAIAQRLIDELTALGVTAS